MARLKYAWERGSAHWNTQSKHSIFLINELSKWVFLRKSVNSRYGLAYEVVADGILKSAIKRNHSFTLSHIFRAGPWSRGRLVIVSSRQTSTAGDLVRERSKIIPIRYTQFNCKNWSVSFYPLSFVPMTENQTIIVIFLTVEPFGL